MARLKTRKTTRSVKAFIDGIADDARRKDCRVVMKIMRAATGRPPAMWGPSIVGYGSYRYVYDSGRAGDWFLTGFSPRKQALTLYLMTGCGRHVALMNELGKYRTGKACLYIKTLADVDLAVLEELVTRSVEHVRETRAACGHGSR